MKKIYIQPIITLVAVDNYGTICEGSFEIRNSSDNETALGKARDMDFDEDFED